MTKIQHDCEYAIVKLDQDGKLDQVCLNITGEVAEYCERFMQLQISQEKKEKLQALLDHLLLSLQE